MGKPVVNDCDVCQDVAIPVTGRMKHDVHKDVGDVL
jgi:hypothetical protein